MLARLGIRDLVLIDSLAIEFAKGLTVLTGETGAGKSILLDALGLALGSRADSALVREGAGQAIVTAEFELGAKHPAVALLAEQGLDAEGALVIRRTLSADGKSRALVNDQPVSVGLLRRLGGLLVEIEGQFEQHGLLDPVTHRELLDCFAASPAQPAVATAYARWQAAIAARETAEADFSRARAEEEYLRHAAAELDRLAPEPDEEAGLARQRTDLQQREKLLAAITAASAELTGERAAQARLAAASRQLDRLPEAARARIAAALAAIERAQSEIEDAACQLDALAGSELEEGGRLDSIEERLFALRAAARKHQVSVDDLAALRRRMAELLAGIDQGSDRLALLAREEQAARVQYLAEAEALSDARKAAALRLDKGVLRELPPLKLEKARFATRIERLPESGWSAAGWDQIAFEVATNPGAAPGPLNRIASGGELARFMLALKLVLAATGPVATLIFDEVDSGIGGAVAAAVGERLARLGERLQLLVVTHSPQVAARGNDHWRVSKRETKGRAVTEIERLPPDGRREEIARMLSGSVVTDEARRAAESLLA